ncbi:MAG: phosphodiesterase [Desulfovibrionaceae bacterium]|nr:MAG: phosphodiesterase [Desulfovibrionaceae bacterium]
MRIAVISDTHLDAPSDWFKRFFDEHLLPADALIHCGDTTGVAMHDYMAHNHPNFHGVAGNCCDWRVGQELPAMLRLNLGGRTIGVTHGWGDRPSLPARLPEAFGPGFDLILFGHTHRQTNIRFGDTLVVNPGSLSGDKPCMAFIDLDEDITVDLRCFKSHA